MRMSRFTKTDVDVIVVGAGHNGLISAAYLAKAGYRVAVFEKRTTPGGAVSTEELFPGYQIDLGGSAHILIRLTPIVDELSLEQHGLSYIDLDPLFFAPHQNNGSLFIHRDLESTVDHLNQQTNRDGDRYGKFIREWQPFAEAMKDAFLSRPGPLELGKHFVMKRGLFSDRDRALKMILAPYSDVVDHYFSDERLKTMLVWMAAQSGPPPNEPMTAPFLLWQPLYHSGGIARPRGGSGILSRALVSAITSNGGSVITGTPVSEILIENGRASGVRTADGICTARAVISGCHVLETFEHLLAPEHQPKGTNQIRVGNGFGAVLRLALNKPVVYTDSPGNDARVALQLVCRDRRQLSRAYSQFLNGEPATEPPIVAMTFSAIDDSLAPPGGEVLWLWAQYFPYELANGSWDQIGPTVADSIIDQFERYAPGTRDSIVGSLFQHPLWLERELGLRRGNVMHIEMSLDQMFGLRPMPRMGSYRTHIRGLFLTGASTHPGGGIMGASGRNTATIVLKDLSRRRL